MVSHVVLSLRVPTLEYVEGDLLPAGREGELLGCAHDRALIAQRLAEEAEDDNLTCLLADVVALVRSVELAITSDGPAVIEYGEIQGDPLDAVYRVTHAVSIGLETGTPPAAELRNAMAGYVLSASDLAEIHGKREVAQAPASPDSQ